tara:strand:- start:498 stop:1250 length:753 start_codon:yes stop_codon:yes gene_type:complete
MLKKLLILGSFLLVTGCIGQADKEIPKLPDGAYKLEYVQITESGISSKEFRNQLKIYSNNRYMFAFMHPQIGVDAGAGLANWNNGVMTEIPLFNHNGSVNGFKFDVTIDQTNTGFTQSLVGLITEDGRSLDMIETWETVSTQESPYDGLWQQIITKKNSDSKISEIKMIGGGYFITMTRSEVGSVIEKNFHFGNFTIMDNKRAVQKTITSSDEAQIGIEKILTVGLVKDGLISNSVSDNGIEITSRYKKI